MCGDEKASALQIPTSLTTELSEAYYSVIQLWRGDSMRQSKVVTVSIPLRLLRKAERLAQKEHRTKSEVVRDALRLYLGLQSDKGFRLADAAARTSTPDAK